MDQLPDSVIVSILSTVTDAKWLVQCAVLSKRFNSLVWQVPELRFSSSETFEAGDGHRRRCYGSRALLEPGLYGDFEDVITDTVLKMTGLQFLTVESDVEYMEISEEAVEVWLEHAGHILRKLKLHTEKSLARDVDCTLPNLDMVLLKCKNLEHLDLSVGMLPLGPCCNAQLGVFKRLTVLKVSQLVVDRQVDLSAMVSCMPYLETLVLEVICGIFRNVVDLEGPRLRRLVLTMVPLYKTGVDALVEPVKPNHKQKIAIRAPNLEVLELTVHGTYSVSLEGGGKLKHLQANVWFAKLDLELSPDVKTLETLVLRANLESAADNGRGYWKTWEDILSRFNGSLQKLTWGVQFFEEEDIRAPAFGGYSAGGIFRTVAHNSGNAMPSKRPIPIHPLQFCRNFHELRILSIESSDFVRSLERGFILLSNSIGQKAHAESFGTTTKVEKTSVGGDKPAADPCCRKEGSGGSDGLTGDSNSADGVDAKVAANAFEAMSCLPKLERLLLQLESVREVTVAVLSLFLDESPSLRNVFVCTGKFQRAWSGGPEQMGRLHNLERKYSRVKFRFSASATSMDSRDFLV